jgi:hypothetical protein
MASTSGRGSCPTRSTSHDRSTSSKPSGTATESLGSPVAVEPSSDGLRQRHPQNAMEYLNADTECR